MIKLTIEGRKIQDMFFKDIPFAEPFLGTPLHIHSYGLYVKVKSYYDKREILMPLFEDGVGLHVFGGKTGGQAWYAPEKYSREKFKVVDYQPVDLDIKAVPR